ncbi:hypothetical protein FSP39_011159 [Pinctada imbricata]|uniref:Max-binding protein MNT n=1 Tax=Pinctada imbricata TaxID=66713 RepID=A0AA89BVR0_PINIB|nr:hypothetical protein FSP39_011159 [Pinctada imbricata]
MSLNTLLEAAEFLEWRNQSKTRADDATQDSQGSSKNATTGGSDTSPESSNSGQNMFMSFMELEDLKEKRRSGGAGTREVHNKLEKNRRAHLKECFDFLKKQIPTLEDKRSSNLGILRGSIRYIQALKRKEREYEQEMQRLAREKISLRERMSSLKMELAAMNIEVDLNQWRTLPDDCESNSTSTATEQGSPICSEDEEDEELRGTKRKTPPLGSGKEIHSGPVITHVAGMAYKDQSIKHNNMKLLKVLTPFQAKGAPTVAKHPPAQRPPLTLGLSSGVVTSTAPKVGSEGKPPITKLLAQTLERRQLKNQQEKHQQELLRGNLCPKPATTAVSVPLNIPGPATIQALRAGQPPRQQLAFPIPGVGAQILATSPAQQLAALNRLAVQASVTMPVSGLTAIPMTSLAKGLTQPFLVTMGGIAAVPQSATTTVSTTTPIVTLSTSASTVSTSATTASKPSVLQTALNTSGVPLHTIPMTAIAAVPTLRPIIGPAGATAQMFGHIPFNLLAASTMTRTSVPSMLAQVTTVTNSTSTTAQTVTTSLQSPAVQQLMAAQGGQLLSPMTVMSPTINLAPNLTQTQLSSMLSQPLLKPIPFPMFHQGLIQGSQVGGVLSQPVVKPLVVVSIPNNVVTTSSVSLTSASSNVTSTTAS